MKQTKKRDRLTTFLLLAAAVLLLAGGGVGSTRAALTWFSENYTARVTVSDIGITLVENGEDVSWRDYTGSDDRWKENTGALLTKMLDTANGEQLALGKAYPEELTVRNSGSIDHYARVIVYRYWTETVTDDKNREQVQKKTDVSPELIGLHLTKDSGWILDKDASTPERMVLYYSKILKSGETAPAFADSLTIDGAAAGRAKETRETRTEEDGTKTTIIKTTYEYNGIQFVLEAEADAVQTHNAEEAIMSAWGVDAKIGKNGQLSLR